MIFETCQDDREAVLQQELLLYLAPLIVSSPEMFASVLRMRVGYADAAFCSLVCTSGDLSAVHDLLCA